MSVWRTQFSIFTIPEVRKGVSVVQKFIFPYMTGINGYIKWMGKGFLRYFPSIASELKNEYTGWNENFLMVQIVVNHNQAPPWLNREPVTELFAIYSNILINKFVQSTIGEPFIPTDVQLEWSINVCKGSYVCVVSTSCLRWSFSVRPEQIELYCIERLFHQFCWELQRIGLRRFLSGRRETGIRIPRSV